MGSSDRTGTNGNGKSKWRATRETVSWTGGPADSMREAIGRLTDNGCAVLFSRTSDGGALSVQVLAGNERSKEYITSYADITPCLAWLIETYG